MNVVHAPLALSRFFRNYSGFPPEFLLGALFENPVRACRPHTVRAAWREVKLNGSRSRTHPWAMAVGMDCLRRFTTARGAQKRHAAKNTKNCLFL
jgi:hypothetical protein